MSRDRLLEPRVTPPPGLDAVSVRKLWPGAMEDLEGIDPAGDLVVVNGILSFESDSPGPPIDWVRGRWRTEEGMALFDGEWEWVD